MRLRDQVVSGIRDVLNRNAVTPSSLRGGAFCASFERPPDGEPWVQVKTGVFNVFYPSDEEPLSRLRPLLPSLPPDTVAADWEAWKYATLEFTGCDADHASMLVEQLFVNFYDFPEDTDVTTEILDMRAETVEGAGA